MINIVLIIGGLGNQMFAYAFYYILSKKKQYSFVEIDIDQTLLHHQGYELSNVFSEIKERSQIYYQLVNKIHSQYFTKQLFKTIIQPKVGFVDYVIDNKSPFVVYEGFWQSELYFSECRKEIYRLFKFNEDLISYETRNILTTIKNCNSVSIHIRRGDYIHHEEFDNVCSLDYYEKAFHLILTKIHSPVFYVFTDDPEWVRINFNQFDYILIDWNTKHESWQDMFLMSECKHNIIANSTFSWWGAWLNSNRRKVVIAPKKWFNKLNENDIIPLDWIRI